MKLSILPVAALCLAAASPATAQHHHGDIQIHGHAGLSPRHWGQRHDPRTARVAIDNNDNSVTLLITRDMVALQLTDRMLRQVDHEMDADREDDGAIARFISNAIINRVSSMLRRSVEYRLEELRDVQYRDGRLIITTDDGDCAFDHIEVNDRDVSEAFSPADAQRFVREFHALKAAER